MRRPAAGVLRKSVVVRGNGCFLPRWQRWQLLAAGALGALCVVIILIGVLASADRGVAVPGLIAAGLTCMSAYAIGAARICVAIDERGVMIRNGWRRSLVSWNDFDAFIDVRRLGRHEGYLRRRDGSRLSCAILRARGIMGGRREVERLVAELNQTAARLRPAEPEG